LSLSIVTTLAVWITRSATGTDRVPPGFSARTAGNDSSKQAARNTIRAFRIMAGFLHTNVLLDAAGSTDIIVAP
jgi:hypothetical protein